MSNMKFFLYLLFFIFLISIHSSVYSQEKMIITKEKVSRTILVFSTKNFDKEVLDVLISENLPKRAFSIGTSEGRVVAFSGTETVELKGVKEAAENIKSIAIDLKTFIDAFKGFGFEVDQIEVWVNVAMETEGVTKLFISAKGEGGIKVLIKPK